MIKEYLIQQLATIVFSVHTSLTIVYLSLLYFDLISKVEWPIGI